MKKLAIGITLLSFAFAFPSQAQDTSPLKQAEYETMMGCIGKFEGGYQVVVHLTSLSSDKAWSESTIASGKKIKAGMDKKRNLAATTPYSLDEAKGETIRAASKKPFQNIIASGTPAEQWEYYKENASISQDCKTTLRRAAYALYR